MRKLFVLLLIVSPLLVLSQKGEVTLPSGLVIADNDEYGLFTWWEAKEKCEKKGKGWSLPNNEELKEIYQNKDTINGFKEGWFWSITEDTHGLCIFSETNGYSWNIISTTGTFVSNHRSYRIKARCVKHY